MARRRRGGGSGSRGGGSQSNSGGRRQGGPPGTHRGTPGARIISRIISKAFPNSRQPGGTPRAPAPGGRRGAPQEHPTRIKRQKQDEHLPGTPAYRNRKAQGRQGSSWAGAPTWFTIVERMESEPFRDLIAGIGAHCEVIDTTDENDDVAYIYALTRGEQMWVLALSCVGPYAVFARSNSADNVWHEILTAGATHLDEFEDLVVRALRRAGMRLLSREELERPVPLKLDGVPQEHVRVYQALITPGEILPWDTGTLRRLGLI